MVVPKKNDGCEGEKEKTSKNLERNIRLLAECCWAFATISCASFIDVSVGTRDVFYWFDTFDWSILSTKDTGAGDCSTYTHSDDLVGLCDVRVDRQTAIKIVFLLTVAHVTPMRVR